MKCLVVVNQLNDPFYIDYDASFAEYIIRTSKEKGFLGPDADESDLDANLVMQLFSPLVLSQWLLIDQTKEPCSAIHCPNGFRFVFRHLDDLLFFAINGDGTESEMFLHRKIRVFIKLMRFLFGPVSEESGLSHLVSKKAKWDFLRHITRQWCLLVETEQSFLVEAIERLHVNQLISEKSVEILERAMKVVQSARDTPVQHAMLLVNNKLLALYSNRSAHELNPKDILSVMLLASTLYPQTERLEDLFSRQYAAGLKAQTPSRVEENSDGGDEEYHSAPNTPNTLNRSRCSSHSDIMDSDIVVGKDSGSDIVEESAEMGTPLNHSLVDSLNALSSLSESDTVRNTTSSDNGENMNNTSLLDMYKEKYPDALFEGFNPKLDYSNSDMMSDGKISVTAEVHDVGGPKVLENANIDWPESISSTPSGSQDDIIEKSKCKVSETQRNDVTVDNKKTSENTTIATFFVKSGDHGDLPRKTSDVSKYSSPYEKDTQFSSGSFRTASNGSPLVSNLASGEHTLSPTNPDAVTPLKTNKQVKGQGATLDSSSTSTPSSASKKKTSVSSFSSRKLSSPSPLNENEIRRRVSRSSTQSSTDSLTPGVASVSEVSRSSSAMSSLSQGYPELTATQEKSSNDYLLSSSKPRNSPHASGFQKGSSRKLASMNVSPIPSVKTVDSGSTIGSTMGSSLFGSPSQAINNKVYYPKTVFLKTSTCRYSPYSLTTAHVLPGVTLVLLSQAPRHLFADYLYQVLHSVQDLLYGRRSELSRSRSLSVLDFIHSRLEKLHGSLKKYKGKIRNLSFDIQARWEKEDLRRKLLDFLGRDKRASISPELESPLLEIYKRLKELFSCLFLYPVPDTQHFTESLNQLRVRVNAELLDYREYLNVKAQRNITMTTYIDDFPGMVHFVFIDRHLHQLTAPSLNISLNDEESLDATSYLKSKIWQMYQCIMGKLTEGYTSVMMREGDFYYSYFLWFEDYAGNSLPVQESFKPTMSLPYPGILSGSFYSKLLSQCFPQALPGSVRCFEMFLLHLGSVHPQYVALHARKLAAKMWEMAGEPYSTPSLF